MLKDSRGWGRFRGQVRGGHVCLSTQEGVVTWPEKQELGSV